MSAPARHDDLTVDTIATALRYIDPNLARREWARIGMALKSELGEDGFRLFDDWSKGGETYDAKSARDTWKSISPTGGVNIGTLIREAQQGGFKFDEDAERPRLTQADIDARKAKREQEQRQAAAELKARQGEAARQANIIWNEALDADDTHPYLVAKNVSAYGLHVGRWPLINDAGKVFRHIDGALLIPIMNAKGKIISLQGIMAHDDGALEKRYLKNAQKRGGFYIIGTPKPGTPVVLCEGYATGATIHRLTGWCVVVAFDEGNLVTVAREVRGIFPGYEYIVAADNDAWTKKRDGTPFNPGVDAAQDVGREINARVIIPAFADTSTRPTDFNDLVALEGDEAAQAQLMAHTMRLPAPANDNMPRPRNSFEAVQAMAEMGVMLSTNARNEPHANLENCMAVLQGHPRFANLIWYDTFHQAILTTWDCDVPRQWVDADRLRVAAVFQRDFGLSKFGDELVEKAAIAVAHDDQRDELRDWLSSLRWDGAPRLDSWMQAAIGAPNDAYHAAVGRNFILSMAARGLTPGCKVDTMPVFEGAQGAGKSRLLAILGGDYYAELTESLDTKDFFVVIQGRWLVEIAELDAFRRSDVTRIKQALSSHQDRCRLPYGKHAVDLPRRVVFAGSTNEHEYLRDHTGARRFWPVTVGRISHAWLVENRSQLFAEAVHRLRTGATWWDMPADEAKRQAEARRESDPWEDSIAEFCLGRRETTVPEVLSRIGVDVAKQGKSEQMRASRILTMLGYQRHLVRRDGNPIRVWMNEAEPDRPY